MIQCTYLDNSGSCLILEETLDPNGYYVNRQWCHDRCWPNNRAAQINMLRKMGVEIKDPPEGVGLLEWVRSQVEAGRIKPKQPAQPIKLAQPCSGCGKMKIIIKGFGRWGALTVFGENPPEWAVERGELCAACEYRTFLGIEEWGMEQGKRIWQKIRGKQLTTLPIDHEPGKWKVAWCSQCTCKIEAKVLVEEEVCPMGKWGQAAPDAPAQLNRI